MPATEREPARHSSATDKSVFVLVKSFYESAAADDVASVGQQTHPRIAAVVNAVVALSSVPIVDPPVQRRGAAAAVADLYRPPETVDAAYGCRRCRKCSFPCNVWSVLFTRNNHCRCRGSGANDGSITGWSLPDDGFKICHNPAGWLLRLAHGETHYVAMATFLWGRLDGDGNENMTMNHR
jgi:hypothetical protein